MIAASVAVSLVAALFQGTPLIQRMQASDSVHQASSTRFARATSPIDSAAVDSAAAPRPTPVAFSRPQLRQELRWSDLQQGVDTTSRRPRAIEYSDAYYTRLTIHRVASYAELPLFGAEYILGERLLTEERTGFPSSSLKAAHLGVAGALGVLFTVNTVTGAWNLWDSRRDPANRTLRIVHSVAMLGADAGFAWAGAIGGNARTSTQNAQQHRAVSIGSFALATAGTAIMWFFNK
ncbi:MAG: hypothetical protein M3R65_05540 [Gemmatimonadota bacterium]|nr:hypothetical protein [Gemmatimonadota bacterium]